MWITREATITYAALAFLAGLIVGLASCAPECAYPAVKSVQTE
jgi:hypothetical protein